MEAKLYHMVSTEIYDGKEVELARKFLAEGYIVGIREVMAELSRLAIGSGDLNLQSYVVGLLASLTEKYGS